MIDGNSAQCEELASHGYIIVGISHPYDNCIVQFPDGRIADGLKSIAKRRPIEQENLVENSALIWLFDTYFVLDQLEQLAFDKTSLFYQRFDQNRIGIFGHSIGGSTAIKSSCFDSRIKAAVNLDGALFGPKIKRKIDIPVMVMLAGNGVQMHERPWTQDEWKKFSIRSVEKEEMVKVGYLPAIKELSLSAQHDFITLVVKNTGHFDFCDLAFYKWTPLVLIILTMLDRSGLKLGLIDGFRATEIVNAYLVNFFDKYLKNKPSELLDGKSKRYEEVEEKQWR